jgi:serine/threonine protein kinase
MSPTKEALQSGEDPTDAPRNADPTIADDGDETQVSAAAGRGDDVATMVNLNRINPDNDRTLVLQDEIEDAFDILSDDALAAAETARASQSTDADWQASRPVGFQGSVEFREGSLLRNRFILETKLGEGGMGAVWKGVDKLKQEARDRNPYVAIKLLQGDFKDHPEAFIALQRETSKQQRLAHPNIATVYDFDRDDATATVFMTMEVLSGADLAAYIRRQVTPDGLDYEPAMQLIRQLGSGLAHAHSHELVHSDLKPGNCFVTEDSTVKLLDFGIARASKTKADAEGETTVFDPGQLGALTPAYATIEMFDGMDPDPRDDIYAMAIIAYQLFTGKHPFGRKNAPKAEAAGMIMPPVAKLTKAQNRALAEGLAFRRDDRTESVENFLAGLEPKKSNAWLLASAAAVILALVIAVGWPVVRDMQYAAEREDFIAALIDPGTMNSTFGRLGELSSDDQRRLVLEDQSVRTSVASLFTQGNDVEVDEKNAQNALALLQSLNLRAFERDIKGLNRVQIAVKNLYTRKAKAAFDPAKQRYDWRGAKAAIEALKRVYPDLASHVILNNSFTKRYRDELARLKAKFNRLMDEGKLIRTPDEDIFDVREIVKQIDPSDTDVLQNKQLSLKVAEFVRAHMEELHFDRADALLKASLEYAPDDTVLADLRFQVEQELLRQANESKIAEIETRLRARDAEFTSLAAFQADRADLMTLADLAPTSEVLEDLQGRLTSAFDKALRIQLRKRDWNAAEQLLVDFAKLFPLDYLDNKRESLTSAETKNGFELAMTAQRQAQVATRQQNVSALLENPTFDSDWEVQLQVPFKELIALLPAEHPALEPIRQRIADQYIARAAESRGRRLTTQARSFIARGENFHPGYDGFLEEVDNIVEVETTVAKERAEAERVAGIERNLDQVLARSRNLETAAAEEALKALEAAATDAESANVASARVALAGAYAQLAKSPAGNEDWGKALKLVARGLELAPASEVLIAAKTSYDKAYQKVRDVEQLKEILQAKTPLDAKDLRTRLDKVAAAFPERFKARYKGEFEKLATARFASMSVVSGGDLKVVASEVSAIKQLFGDKAAAVAQTTLAPPMTERVRTLEASDVNAAASYLSAARGIAPKATSLSRIKLRIPSKKAAEGLQLVDAGQITRAQKILAEVGKTEPNAPNIPAFRSALTARKAKAEAEFAKFKRYAKAGRKRQGKRFVDSALKLWADNASYKQTLKQLAPRRKTPGSRNICSANKAGLGTKSRATCWDKIGKARGPTLVVVPPGGDQDKPFAIGKLEVTVSDYNRYCRAGGPCNPLPGDGKLPATGLTLGAAQTYANWLSKQSGARYRLPTDAEWEHAARAGGKQPGKKNYNCTVKVGDQMLKGQSLRTALSGQQNGWGLINYIGNAKEWVRSGDGVSVRGGAHTDPMSKCALELREKHSGNADPVAGFRLVRELS